jgi:hypothetical protein
MIKMMIVVMMTMVTVMRQKSELIFLTVNMIILK